MPIKKTLKVIDKNVKESIPVFGVGAIDYSNHEKCICGNPVAKHLGQNQVCVEHIRAK
jgi:hypothetical protein